MFDEAHVTEPVTSSVVPLLIVPVALNCVVIPFAMLRLVADRVIDCSVAVPVPDEDEEQLLKATTAQTQ
jgi:hypothetical protein